MNDSPQSDSSADTISPWLATLAARKPTGEIAGGSTADTRTTGRPCLVTTSSDRVRAISSISSRQVALNVVAETSSAGGRREGRVGFRRMVSSGKMVILI